MRTKFKLNVRARFKKVRTEYVSYDALFAGKIKVATYQPSLHNWNLFTAYSTIRSVPLGTFDTEQEAIDVCIKELMLLVERLSSHD